MSEDSEEPLRDSVAQEEFVLLFTREQRRIYSFARSLVPSAADADDIFQQVSLVLWRRYSEFDVTQDFYKWACGITYYTVLNFRRHKGRKRVYFSDQLIEQLAKDRIKWSKNEPERLEALRYCVNLLKEKDRKLIGEVYEAGSTVKDAAEKLGHSVQSTYNRISLIRKRLLECVTNRLAPGPQGAG